MSYVILLVWGQGYNMKVFIVYVVRTCEKTIKKEFKSLEFPGLPVLQIEKIK